METTKSWREMMGAFDRRHNYSSRGIWDKLKTIKRAGRKLIVEGIVTHSQAWMKQENLVRIMAVELLSKEEWICRS